MKETVAAVIVAAGSGKRMGLQVKKQYLIIEEYPVLYYSLKAFSDYGVEKIVLVVPEEDIEYCKEHIVNKYGFCDIVQVVAGGKERYDSVLAGLEKVNEDYVLIHDGARPCISINLIERCVQAVKKYKACILSVPVKETVKVINEEGFIVDTPNRSHVWLAQTPQAFDTALLKQAYTYTITKEMAITDDAMMVEHFLKIPVKVVEGEYTNIKITTKEDIRIATDYLREQNS